MDEIQKKRIKEIHNAKKQTNRSTSSGTQFTGSNERSPQTNIGQTHRRSEETRRAIRQVKDEKGEICVFCGKRKADGYTIHGMHLLSRDSFRKRENKTDPRQIMPGCFWHHKEYDSKNAHGKLKYLLEHIYLRGNNKLIDYAKTLAYILNMDYESPEDVQLEELRREYEID